MAAGKPEHMIRVASLCLLAAVALAALAGYGLGWRSPLGSALLPWAAGALVLVAVFPPGLIFLARLARPILGRLQRVMSPVILAALFYGVLTPVGLVRRTLSDGGLRVRRSRGAGQPDSYWRPVQATPDDDGMERQF